MDGIPLWVTKLAVCAPGALQVCTWMVDATVINLTAIERH
eukprot:COSAG05_NODE_374_length_10669_cov_71.040587_13_plen_39_part_01